MGEAKRRQAEVLKRADGMIVDTPGGGDCTFSGMEKPAPPQSASLPFLPNFSTPAEPGQPGCKTAP